MDLGGGGGGGRAGNEWEDPRDMDRMKVTMIESGSGQVIIDKVWSCAYGILWHPTLL